MNKTFLALLFVCVFLPSVLQLQAQGSLPRLPAPEGLCTEGAALLWQAVDGASGYRIRWRISGQPWQGMNLQPTHTGYVLRDLQPDMDYEIQVQAQASGRIARNSFWSSSLRIRQSATATPTPESTPNLTLEPTKVDPSTGANTPEPPQCLQIDAYSRTQEYETLCFDFDLNEMAPCVYRLTCTGTCYRMSSTYCPVEQETCGPWQYGYFLRSGDVSGTGGSNGAGEIVDTLEATPENAHDFVGG